MDTRKGDIPETDEELEKMLKKPVVRPSMKRQKMLAEQELQQRQEWDAANRAIAPDLVHGSPAVEEFLANHEPGQPLPEDMAERVASGSGWQGEEINEVTPEPVVIPCERLQELAEEFNTPLDEQVQTAKQAYKKSRGKTISPEVAAEIAAEEGLDENGRKVEPARVKSKSLVMLQQQPALKPVVLDGNGQVVTDKKMAKALVRVEQRKAQRSKLTDEQKKRYEELERAEQPEITEALVATIMQLLGEGKSTIEVREITKVHYGTIRGIAKGTMYSKWSGLGTTETTKEGEK